MRLTFLDHLLGRKNRTEGQPSLLDDIDEIEILPVRYDAPEPTAEGEARRKREVQRLIIDNALLRDLKVHNEPGCCLIRINQRSRLVIYPDYQGHAVLSEQVGRNIVIHFYRELAMSASQGAVLDCEPNLQDG